MMNNLIGIWGSSYPHIFALLVNTAWQIALLVMLTFLSIFLLRIRTAATRHSLWLMVIFSPLVLLLLNLSMPAVSIHLLQRQSDKTVYEEIPPPQKYPAAISETVHRSTGKNAEVSISEPDMIREGSSIGGEQSVLATLKSRLVLPISLREILLLLWLSGVLGMTARLVKGLHGLRSLRKNALPVEDDSVISLLNELRDSLGVHRQILLSTSNRLTYPVSFGWRKPIILMPCDFANNMSLAEIKMTFIHEIAHFKRRDYLINIASSLLRIPLFFHPFFIFAQKQLQIQQEHICDDWVIQFSQKRTPYARCLLRQAEVAVLKATPCLGVSAVSGFKNMRRRIERFKQGQEHAVYPLGSSGITNFVYSPDNKYLAVATMAGIRLLNAETLGEREFIPVYLNGYTVEPDGLIRGLGERIPALSLAFSPDSRELYFPTAIGLVAWQIDGESELKQFGLDVNPVDIRFPRIPIAVSSSGQVAVGSGGGGQISLLSFDEGYKMTRYDVHSNAILGLSFSGDGTTLTTASRDGTIKIWHIHKMREPLRTIPLKGIFGGMSADGTHIVTAGDGYIRLWNIKTGEEISLEYPADFVRMSPDGEQFATIRHLGDWHEGEYEVKFWDVITGECLKTLTIQKKKSLMGSATLGLAPDGQTFAFGIWGSSAIRVYDKERGKLMRQIKGYLSHTANFSCDSRLLAIGASATPFEGDNEFQQPPAFVVVFDLESKEVKHILAGHELFVQHIHFSPDAKHLAASSNDKTIVWNLETEEIIDTPSTGIGGIYSRGEEHTLSGVHWTWKGAYPPMPNHKEARGADGNIVARPLLKDIELGFETPSGRKTKILHGHTLGVRLLVLSPDKRWLVSIPSDDMEGLQCLLWDLERVMAEEYSEDEERIVK